MRCRSMPQHSSRSKQNQRVPTASGRRCHSRMISLYFVETLDLLHEEHEVMANWIQQCRNWKKGWLARKQTPPEPTRLRLCLLFLFLPIVGARAAAALLSSVLAGYRSGAAFGGEQRLSSQRRRESKADSLRPRGCLGVRLYLVSLYLSCSLSLSHTHLALVCRGSVLWFFNMICLLTVSNVSFS